MSKKGKVESEKIHIVDFIIEKASLNSQFGQNADNVENHSLDIEYNIGFNLNERLAKADLSIEVSAKSEKEEIALGYFKLIYIFHIENLDELAVKEGDSITVNSGLGIALASITYSTSRGVLMTRFQGTLLKDFILPIIDPQSLLKN